MELPCDAAIPLVGVYPKEWKPGTLGRICPHMLIAASFIISKMEANQVYMDGQMVTKWGISIQSNMILPYKGREF